MAQFSELSGFTVYKGSTGVRQASAHYSAKGQAVTLIYSRDSGWLLCVYVHPCDGECITASSRVSRDQARRVWRQLKRAQGENQ